MIVNELKTSVVSMIWALALALLLGGNFFIGRPEGYVFPVVKNLHIVSVTQNSDGYLDYELTADKVRDCTPIGSGIFYTAKGYTIRVLPKRELGWTLVGRPPGHQRISLKLPVPPNYAKAPLTFIMQHKCFGPMLWTTTSVATANFDGPLLEPDKLSEQQIN